MKKKVIAALFLCMALGTAGCSGNTAKETETQAQTETQAPATEASTEEAEIPEAAPRPEYKALDYVTLGEYKGLEVTLQSIEPSEEEIEEQIQSALSQNDKMEELKEGTVENGDVANIDYEGKLDGEAFDGGTDKGFDLTIGSGSFIAGFEEGLVGKKIGETVDLDLTFPESYHATELAGKAVVFTVTINSVKRAPELTDELAAEISEYKTVEEYRASVKDTLKEQKKSEQESMMLNDLVGMAYQNAEIKDYPQEMIDYQLGKVTEYYKGYAEQSGMEYADFLEQQIGMTEAEFTEQMTETVKQSMGTELVLRAIAETENIEIGDEEFRNKAEEYAAQSGMTDVDAFIKQYGEGEIMASILQDKAVELMKENAVVHDPDAAQAEDGTGESETAGETESEA